MKKRIVLYADKDKVLTNGEIYGAQIFLAEGESPDDYREITQKEYQSILDGEGARQDEQLAN